VELHLRIISYIPEMIQAITKVTIEYEYEVIFSPLNGVISNDCK